MSGSNGLRDAARRWLCALLAAEAKVPVDRVERAVSFDALGLDSILITRMNDRLEEALGEVPKTLFFEVRNAHQLADHLLERYPDKIQGLLGPSVEVNTKPPAEAAWGTRRPLPDPGVHFELVPRREWRRNGSHDGVSIGGPPVAQTVAVIGISGRYPGADDLNAFWENLCAGRESIREVPPERWDWKRYHASDPDNVPPAKSYGRWGGFLEMVDKFDPLFFGISPKEAAGMDPQERLFLETAWEAVEHAGYSRAALAEVESRTGMGVGVFVGITKNGYDRYRMAAEAAGDATTPHAFHWTVANRVSYVLDIRGPSIPVDTACSSSLTAIHEACQSILHGECAMAIAGGVNLYLHPSNFAELCEARMLSTDGRCRSFGEGGNGFVPGEGVGALILKPLAQAERDGDYIWGVIRGSAVNHGGRTNGFLVPNPAAQASVIKEALRAARVDARTISYVEAHGTGTALGDPIEVAGLSKAFELQTTDTAFCALGSIKPNIGHLEAAAGVAGVTKVLLQLAHATLVPSLNCTPPNPNIDFARTPFRMQAAVSGWPRPSVKVGEVSHEVPRRAGVSSFGAGGANAHAVLEEYVRPELPGSDRPAVEPSLVVLSARDEATLRRSAERLLAFLSTPGTRTVEERARILPHLAYTLQVGREPFKHRLAVVCTDVEDLSTKLRGVVQDPASIGESVYQSSDLLATDRGVGWDAGGALSASAEQVEQWWRARDLVGLARVWVAGHAIDWVQLNRGQTVMRRVPLPTYPFARQRCWFAREPIEAHAVTSEGAPREPGIYFRTVWRRAEPPPGEERGVGGTVLIVVPERMDSVAAALLLAREGRGEVIQVTVGEHTRQTGPGRFEVRADDPDAFVSACAAASNLAEVCVLGPAPPAGGGVDPMARDGGLLLFRLIRQLERVRLLERELFFKIVTFQAHDIPTGQDAHASMNPWGASMIGLTMSLAREYPHLRVEIVDADLALRSDMPAVEMATLRALAANHTTGPSVFAVRRGQWFRRVLEPIVLANVKQALRRGGVYLIVGGAGGIGLETCLHLVRRYAARLIIVGRRSQQQVRDRLRAIERAGGEYVYCQADAAEAVALRRSFEEGRRRFGAIHGVFHSALVLEDQSISQMEEATFGSVVRAKVCTAVALAEAAREHSLDFLVFFSSAQSFVGNHGQANYAAACTFLDAYAASLSATSPFPVKNINWGYWGTVGVVATPEHRRIMARKGMRSLDVGEGMEAVESLLSAPDRQVAVLKAEPHALEHFGVEVTTSQPLEVSIAEMHAMQASTGDDEAVDDLFAASVEVLDEGERNAGRLEELALLMLFRLLRTVGLFTSDKDAISRDEVMRRIGVNPRWLRLLDAAIELLVRAGYLSSVHGRLKASAKAVASGTLRALDRVDLTQQTLLAEPSVAPHVRLLASCIGSLPEVWRGKMAGTEVLFPGGSSELVAPVYQGLPLPDLYNRATALAVRAAVEHRVAETAPGTCIRILELGAGTGSATSFILEEIGQHAERVEYWYTDLSRDLKRHGVDRFSRRYPFVRGAVLDISRPPDAQRFDNHSIDVVVASNVLHATPNLRHSLRHVRSLLARDGALVLNEALRFQAFTTLTFGLLEGWWLYDDERRSAHSPLLDADGWVALLAEEGYRSVRVPGGRRGLSGLQGIVLARAPESAVPSGTTSVERPDRTNLADIERQLRNVLKDVLEIPESEIDPNVPFAELGLDSIGGASVVRRVNQLWSLDLRPLDLFAHETVRKLAHLVGSRSAAPAPTPDSDGESPFAKQGLSESAPVVPDGSVAVIGMAGRFPGAADVQQFWENLFERRDCITAVPPGRCQVASASLAAGGVDLSWSGGFIDDVDRFDAAAFGISPAEALVMDPQQRLFLEEAWKALEDAGYSVSRANNGACGVFVAVANGDYLDVVKSAGATDSPWTATGNSSSVLAGRIAYALNLKGPTISIDTACASSLAALHLAVGQLRAGLIDMAIVGAVNVMCTGNSHLAFTQNGMASPTGRCQPLDEVADGFVPAEAVCAVVLRRAVDAERDRDHVYGLVRATGMNHSGRGNGLTAPNAPAQTELIQDIYASAAIDPLSVSLIEIHGTGTRVGDAIELQALSQVFGKEGEGQPCVLGLTKANLGHALVASGLVSVIKVLLCLEKRQIPPLARPVHLSPDIDLGRTRFQLNDQPIEWRREPVAGPPLRAAVNTFGFNGSNAHAVLESVERACRREPPTSDVTHAIVLSARTTGQLHAYALRLLTFVRNNPEALLVDIAYTLQVGRTPMKERLALLVSSREELEAKLEAFVAGAAERTRLGNEGESGGSERAELAELASTWVRGTDVDWQEAVGTSVGRTISLPTYPFEATRHWVQAVLPTAEAVTLFERTWRSAPLLSSTNEASFADVLVVAGPGVQPSDVEEEALFSRLQMRGAHCVFDGAQDLPSRAPTTHLDYSRDNAFAGLLLANSKGTARWKTLVYLPSTGERQDLHALFKLCQDVIATNPAEETHVLVLYSANRDRFGAAHGAIIGFARTLHQEHSKLRCKVVRVDDPGVDGPDPGDLWRVLNAELRLDAWNDLEVMYGGGARSIRANGPLTSTALAQAPSTTCVARAGGTYLITGGAGGLARIFGRHLVALGARRVVFTDVREPDEEAQQAFREIERRGGKPLFIRADLADRDAVMRLVAQTRAVMGSIHGVLHSAGLSKPNFIARKNLREVDAVLAPKVEGTTFLDEATANEPLDWFVAFSSLAAVNGYVANCDYAYANAYLDYFVQEREARRRRGARKGKSLVVFWPPWKESTMGASSDFSALLGQLGIEQLDVTRGLTAFDLGLRSGHSHIVVLGGQTEEGRLPMTPPARGDRPDDIPRRAAATSIGRSISAVRDEVRGLAAGLLKIDITSVDPTADLSSFGLESALFTRFAADINARFKTTLTPAAFFEHGSIDAIARLCTSAIGTENDRRQESVFLAARGVPEPQLRSTSMKPSTQVVGVLNEPIAIVGMDAAFPGARDLQTYWQNLKDGRILIGEPPRDRWPDAIQAGHGHEPSTRVAWGAFMADADRFDARFFGVSAREAALMDPQQRLFLQAAWHAFEDAGYPPSSMADRKVGVFVGASTSDYAFLLNEQGRGEDPHGATGAAHSVLANRVSHLLDLHGPSEAIDSACSSSLVAIHRAVASLRLGECDLALAGGVNVIAAPHSVRAFAAAGLLSPDGRVCTFDEHANGFVCGEGVGALLLKPLSRAVEDGDRIHAVIRGSAVGHGGHSRSLTAPSPQGQLDTVIRAYRAAGVDAGTVSYVEAHGSSNALTDAVELNALTKALSQLARDPGNNHIPRCGIGSVKPSIGNLGAASGIASICKIILALRHDLLPGTVNVRNVNPALDLGSRFDLVTATRPWTRPHSGAPRRASVNSFGFGGTNAHMVLEEYIPRIEKSEAPEDECQHSVLCLFSAKDEEALQRVLTGMAEHLDRLGDRAASVSLQDIAHSLMFGREHFAIRVALRVSSVEQLRVAVRALASGAAAQVPDGVTVLRGQLGQNHPGTLLSERSLQRFLDVLVEGADWDEIGRCWVNGIDPSWDRLGARLGRRRKVSLPPYPFAKTRHWVALEGSTRDRTGSSPASPSPGFAAVTPPAPCDRSPAEALTEEIRQVLADPTLHVEAARSLVDYGLDSIMAAQLKAGVAARFGVDVQLSDLLGGLNVGQLIATVAAGPKAGGERVSPDVRAESALNPVEEMLRDARVDDGDGPLVRAEGRSVGIPLVTGATGFLGSFVLAALLDLGVQSVSCLVRAGDSQEALVRIRGALRSNGVWRDEFKGRIIPVLGELGQPQFGLQDRSFDSLVKHLSVVYHLGARVNHMLPYGQLRRVNTGGTQEIVRTALLAGARVIFASTTATCIRLTSEGLRVFADEEDISDPDHMASGYAQSKWVGEQLLREARGRGLQSIVLRIGEVGADSRTGLGKRTDLFHTFLQLFRAVGLEPNVCDGIIDIVPIDYASRAIVHLGQTAPEAKGVFHLVHPLPPSLHAFFDWLASRTGRRRVVSEPEWLHACLAHLRRTATPERATVISHFLEPSRRGFPLFKGYFGDFGLRRDRIARLLAGTGIESPPVDERLFDLYFVDGDAPTMTNGDPDMIRPLPFGDAA